MKNKTLYLIITMILNIIFGCISFIGLLYVLMANMISNLYIYIGLLFIISLTDLLFNYLLLKLFNRDKKINQYNILIPTSIFIIFQFLLYFVLCQI